MDIILASQSPRRLQLLQAAGLRVRVCPSHIDETPHAHEPVHDLVKRLSIEKAKACPEHADIIIAADTLVALGEHLFGQPTDLAHAKRMLQQLSGQTHRVLSGICVLHASECRTDVVETKVHFRTLSEHEIDTYLQYNQVLDKAGAYAIQEGASGFITGIEGPLDNVIGLPVAQVLKLAQAIVPTTFGETL